MQDPMWTDRLTEEAKRLERIERLRDDEAVRGRTQPPARLTSQLGDCNRDLASLRRPALWATVDKLWQDLSSLQEKETTLAMLLLDLLGGLAIKHKIGLGRYGQVSACTPDFERWINDLGTQVGLAGPLQVVAGENRMIEPQQRVVHLPFLDVDLWHLPLFGRAIALQLTED